MRDTTWTNTTIAAADLARAGESILRGKRFHLDRSRERIEGTVTIEQAEVDNGGVYDADRLQTAGIPFVLHHESGCAYPEGYTVFDGTRRVWIAAIKGSIVVGIDARTGSPAKGSVDHARTVLAVMRSARRAMRERSRAHRDGTVARVLEQGLAR